MGQVPWTPISGSFTDLLCGLRRFLRASLSPGRKFPTHSGMLKDQRKDVYRSFKDAPMKCVRMALI